MEKVTRKDTIFKLLDQSGPFATCDNVQDQRMFSSFSRSQVKILQKEKLYNRYLLTRNQIFQLLNVSSFAEIKRLINDKERREATTCRAYGLLSRMFGIGGSENECLIAIKNYSRTADGVIRYLKRAVISPYSSYLDIDNKVDAIYDPVELLLILFDNRYHKKARFEAKRKLVLMQLAAAIEQRERETDIENKFTAFVDFLNNQVWSSDVKIGEEEPAFLLSLHCPEDFSCSEVSVHSCHCPEDFSCSEVSVHSCHYAEDFPCSEVSVHSWASKKTDQSLGYGLKKTLIKRLWFHSNAKKIPIYVIVRKKEPVAKVLKLIRKGEENPDIAVADELGLMGVLDNITDVRIFQKHLIESAFRAGTFLTQEDIADTLEGGLEYNGNTGSSIKTPMLKFFARMGGMRVEFIIHTNKSFLNYTYQRGVAHREYEVNRLFDSGVADLLFPKDIYFLDLASIKEELLQLFRKQIETEQY